MTVRALNPSSAPPSNKPSPAAAKSGAGKSGTAGGAGQGTVNDKYLDECRADNPEPEAPADAGSKVVLANCRITTPTDRLVVDQPFDVSIEAKSGSSSATGKITFRLFCAVPTTGGPGKPEDQSASISGNVVGGTAKATGKLLSPKTPVAAGTRLQYHVEAEHPDAAEKASSPVAEVEAGAPPKPLASWTFDAGHFLSKSTFVLPSAAGALADLARLLDAHPGAGLAVFGHADAAGEDADNKAISGRRAYALLCLLTKDVAGWAELAKGAAGDTWDLHTVQTALAHLKDGSGAPYYADTVDGKDGNNTRKATQAFRADHGAGSGTQFDAASRAILFKAYMDALWPRTCAPADFLGDPSDKKRQWACAGCGEFNPALVVSKADDAKFRAASDKTERNARYAPNKRTAVFLFPAGAKGPGNVTFPCPAWNDGVAKCRAQFLPDGEARRNPSDAGRTWERDKDTFACGFYAKISVEGPSKAVAASAKHPVEIQLRDEHGAALGKVAYLLEFADGAASRGESDDAGMILLPDNTHPGPMELTLSDNSASPAAAPGADPDSGDFASWPTLGETPPAWMVDRIRKNRAALETLPNIGPTANGYTYKGTDTLPTEICTPDEAAKPKVKGVLERLCVELQGEGGVSAAMTGDSARFTWGHGMTGSVLARAFTKFLADSPEAKTDFLEHGIAMEGGEWRIVDVDKSKTVSGSAALALLDGKEPMAVKKKFITIFGRLTEKHAAAAANAQWPVVKQTFFYDPKYAPPKDIVESWDPVGVCYVIHCIYWGSFAGWAEFRKTGGDLAKILRLEGEFMYPHNNGTYVLVKESDTTPSGGEVHPATTMLFNLGHGAIQERRILQPLPDLSQAVAGDMVFEIHSAHRSKYGGAAHAVLRGVPRQFDPSDECADWCDKHHYLAMPQLLEACEARSKANLLRVTRNWYDSGPAPGTPSNPQYHRWGMRLRVALDSVLYKNNKSPAVKQKVLADAAIAELPDDQVKVVKSKLGVA